MNFDQTYIVVYSLLTVVKFTDGDECKKIDECSCKTSNTIVDLHYLSDSKNPRFEVSDNFYNYQYQPCGTLSAMCGGKTGVASVCQNSKSSSISYCLGEEATAEFSGNPETNNLKLKYHCSDGGTKRTSTINIFCAIDTEGVLVSAKEDPPKSANYEFVLKTRYACIEGGISTGSILLILFFVCLIVYIVAGVLFLKFARGAQGVELFPNYSFWTSLPGYIKDGVLFTSRGCKTESSYSEI